MRFSPDGLVFANTWDNPAQLAGMVYVVGNTVYLSGTLVENLKGLLPGTSYYLADGGQLTTVPGNVFIGIARDENTLYFIPQQ